MFQALRGVSKVEQGFLSSDPPHDNFSEGVIVHFSPEEITLALLIDVHLCTHASTSNHKLRGKYRSAVYVSGEGQAADAREVLEALQPKFPEPVVTQILQLVAFKPSDESFRDYYQKNAEGPFCSAYIDPKLKLIQARFGSHLSS